MVDWHVPPPPPECSDGDDNDVDGYVDAEDPGCASDLDPSEGHGDPVTDVRVLRRVTLAFSDWTRDRVVIFGRVRNDPAGPGECIEAAPVRIFRMSRGASRHVATVSTSRTGWYVVTAPDRPGRYRATALRFEPGMADGSYVTCVRARHDKPHRHGGDS
jgi:hypothetical protein